MRHKWHVGRKGYLKIHIAVDIKKKRILSLEVTSEKRYVGVSDVTELISVCTEDMVKKDAS